MLDIQEAGPPTVKTLARWDLRLLSTRTSHFVRGTTLMWGLCPPLNFHLLNRSTILLATCHRSVTTASSSKLHHSTKNTSTLRTPPVPLLWIPTSLPKVEPNRPMLGSILVELLSWQWILCPRDPWWTGVVVLQKSARLLKTRPRKVSSFLLRQLQRSSSSWNRIRMTFFPRNKTSTKFHRLATAPITNLLRPVPTNFTGRVPWTGRSQKVSSISTMITAFLTTATPWNRRNSRSSRACTTRSTLRTAARRPLPRGSPSYRHLLREDLKPRGWEVSRQSTTFLMSFPSIGRVWTRHAPTPASGSARPGLKTSSTSSTRW